MSGPAGPGRGAAGGSGEAAGTRRRQAEQLVTALEGRDELALLEASMLLEKIPREELPRLLDQVIAALGARLPLVGGPAPPAEGGGAGAKAAWRGGAQRQPGPAVRLAVRGDVYQALRP